jgi:hypothetical protein
LPTPVSPRISTLIAPTAMRSTTPWSWRIAADSGPAGPPIGAAGRAGGTRAASVGHPFGGRMRRGIALDVPGPDRRRIADIAARRARLEARCLIGRDAAFPSRGDGMSLP